MDNMDAEQQLILSSKGGIHTLPRSVAGVL